jgi:hypothetical protein
MTAKTIVHYIGIGLCIALFPLAAIASGATFRTVYYMQSPYQQPGGLLRGLQVFCIRRLTAPSYSR